MSSILRELDPRMRIEFQEMLRKEGRTDQTEHIRELKQSYILEENLDTLLELKEKYGNDVKKIEEEGLNECGFLYTRYTDLFHKIKNDELDIELFRRLIGHLRDIENEEVDQCEATFNIVKELYINAAEKRRENIDQQKKKEEEEEKKNKGRGKGNVGTGTVTGTGETETGTDQQGEEGEGEEKPKNKGKPITYEEFMMEVRPREMERRKQLLKDSNCTKKHQKKVKNTLAKGVFGSSIVFTPTLKEDNGSDGSDDNEENNN